MSADLLDALFAMGECCAFAHAFSSWQTEWGFLGVFLKVLFVLVWLAVVAVANGNTIPVVQQRRYLRKQESLECKEGLMAVLYGRNREADSGRWWLCSAMSLCLNGGT